MVKRYKRNGLYTLCLAKAENNDIHTFTVNVQYKGRIFEVLEFAGTETTYTVNLDTKQVLITSQETITVYNPEVFFDLDAPPLKQETIKTFSNATLTNIVKGWQY